MAQAEIHNSDNGALVEKNCVLIIHGNDKYYIAVVNDCDTMTVSDLALKVEEISTVPVHAQRLIHKGRSLTDLKAALSKYGIVRGSKIMLLGTKANSSYESEEFSAVCEVEKSLISLEQKLDNICSEIAELEKGYLSSDMQDEMLKKLHKQTKTVSEEFMRKLERLDAMTFHETQQHARSKRKSVVERIQKLLQRIDGISEHVESMSSKPQTN